MSLKTQTNPSFYYAKRNRYRNTRNKYKKYNKYNKYNNKYKNKYNNKYNKEYYGENVQSKPELVQLIPPKRDPYTEPCLCIIGIPPDVSETLLFQIFQSISVMTSIFIARDEFTRLGVGYAYVSFATNDDLYYALEAVNGAKFAGDKLSVFSSKGEDASKVDPRACVKIENMHQTIDNKLLYDTFSVFGEVYAVCVERNMTTGLSCGYGYAFFFRMKDAKLAVKHLNSITESAESSLKCKIIDYQEQAKNITSVFCARIPQQMSREELVGLIEADAPGSVNHVQIWYDRIFGRVGFINFVEPKMAENAAEKLDQFPIKNGAEITKLKMVQSDNLISLFLRPLQKKKPIEMEYILGSFNFPITKLPTQAGPEPASILANDIPRNSDDIDSKEINTGDILNDRPHITMQSSSADTQLEDNPEAAMEIPDIPHSDAEEAKNYPDITASEINSKDITDLENDIDEAIEELNEEIKAERHTKHKRSKKKITGKEREAIIERMLNDPTFQAPIDIDLIPVKKRKAKIIHKIVPVPVNADGIPISIPDELKHDMKNKLKFKVKNSKTTFENIENEYKNDSGNMDERNINLLQKQLILQKAAYEARISNMEDEMDDMNDTIKGLLNEDEMNNNREIKTSLNNKSKNNSKLLIRDNEAAFKEYFYTKFLCLKSNIDKCYIFLKKEELNDIDCLILLEGNDINDVKMNKIHRKLFLNIINDIRIKREKWLQHLSTVQQSNHVQLFNSCGIYTFDEFYLKIKSCKELNKLIQNENDSKLIFYSTPKHLILADTSLDK